MKKQRPAGKRRFRYADLGVRRKFQLMNLAVLVTLLVLCSLMLNALRASERERKAQLESTVLTAAEQYVDMLLESSVSVARSIYVSDVMYKFLDASYSSPTAYFEAFHELQKNSPLILADNNEIISGCTVYTDNPTVMNGSRVQSITVAEHEDWYKTFTRLGKTLILYCDQESGTLSLLRLLDYTPTKSTSILKLDLSRGTLASYCESLDFEGELLVVSGGVTIYSSEPGADVFDVDRDFAATAKNYYTVDIEYYAEAEHHRPLHFLLERWYLLLLTLVSLFLLFALERQLSKNAARRAEHALSAMEEDGDLSAMQSEYYGRDEIGELIRAGVLLSRKLALVGDRHEHTKEALQKEQSASQLLFGQALALEAVSAVQRRCPAFTPDASEECHALREELALTAQVAAAHGTALSVPKALPEELTVPICTVAHTAEVLLTDGGTMQMTYENGALTLDFVRDTVPPQSWALYLGAIFEEDTLSDMRTFRPGDPFNPYRRLKYCFTSAVSADVTQDGRLTLILHLTKGDTT